MTTDYCFSHNIVTNHLILLQAEYDYEASDQQKVVFQFYPFLFMESYNKDVRVWV